MVYRDYHHDWVFNKYHSSFRSSLILTCNSQKNLLQYFTLITKVYIKKKNRDICVASYLLTRATSMFKTKNYGNCTNLITLSLLQPYYHDWVFNNNHSSLRSSLILTCNSQKNLLQYFKLITTVKINKIKGREIFVLPVICKWGWHLGLKQRTIGTA